MTASRPYRPVPLSTAKAIEELKRYAGIQFDPAVVWAFERTKTAQAAGRHHDEPGLPEQKPSPIPLLGQVAADRAKGSLSASSSAPAEP